jgi:diguanylate cyclase (GGDEF)-like protein
LCSIVVLAVDVQFNHANIYNPTIYWNTIVRTCFYLISCLMLVFVRKELFREYAIARVDLLTGVLNPRAFIELLNGNSLTHEFKYPMTVAYVDLDNFKKINDDFGHGEGDKLLKTVAQTMKKSLRPADVIARLGGDEFAVVFPDTDPCMARIHIEKIQNGLSKAMRERKYAMTFSIGAVSLLTAPKSFEEVMKMADRMMYKVKSSGKNGFKIKTLTKTADK